MTKVAGQSLRGAYVLSFACAGLLHACLPEPSCYDTATCPPDRIDASADATLSTDQRGALSSDHSASEPRLNDTLLLDASAEMGLHLDGSVGVDSRGVDDDAMLVHANGDATEAASLRDAGGDARDDQAPPCASGAMRKCNDDPSLRALGNCAEGTQSCIAGSWSPCSIRPAAKDTCVAGDDADCDGSKNEGCPCIDGTTTPCGSMRGVCRQGTQTCSGGAWGACLGEVKGSLDCGKPGDNDCDGTDDALNSACTTPCTLNSSEGCAVAGKQGACAAGHRTCVLASNRQSVRWGECTGQAPAPRDGCNPKDDADCSGVVGDSCCTTLTCGSTCCGEPPPNQAFASCNGSQCVPTCKAGATSAYTCGSSTVLRCGSWAFDSGQREGWGGSWDPRFGVSAQEGSSSEFTVFEGRTVLAYTVPMRVNNVRSNTNVQFRTHLCANETAPGNDVVDLAHRVFTARLRLESTRALPDSVVEVTTYGTSGTTNGLIGSAALPVGKWTVVSFSVDTALPSGVFAAELSLVVRPHAATIAAFPEGRWTGVLYIDEISIY